MPHIVRAQLALKALLMALAFLPAALIAADAAPAKNGATDGPPTVELTVSPAAAPVPALKYRFLTTPAERTRGNAALDYYRAVVQNSLIPSDKAPSWVKDYGLVDVPLDKFPKDEVARQMEPYRQVLIAMERAARRDRCEWQVPLEDGFETQLPEFQNIREPVRLVNTRARLQMARGELEAALESFKINYELSQKITECRTIINSLIGVAIVSITREQLETFVQQPHAPNLYWALSASFPRRWSIFAGPSRWSPMRSKTHSRSWQNCAPVASRAMRHAVSRTRFWRNGSSRDSPRNFPRRSRRPSGGLLRRPRRIIPKPNNC